MVKHAVGLRSAWHPEALAFAGHYGLSLHRCLPRHPATKGKVEQQVDTMRAWCFRGRSWLDLADRNRPWQTWHLEAWLPHVHRTTGTTIHARLPEEQAALRPLPPQPSAVGDRTTRQVAQDGRVSCEGSRSSAPAEVAGQRIAWQVFPDHLALDTLEPIPRCRGEHRRVRHRGSLVEDPTHDPPLRRPGGKTAPWPPAALPLAPASPLGTSLAPRDVPVARRPLTVSALAGTGTEGGQE